MKKTDFSKYSVALSEETGCIVMVKTDGREVTVIGSLTRAQTLKFADDVRAWMPVALRHEPAPAVDADTLN